MKSHPTATLRATGLDCVRGERRLFAGLAFELSNGGLLQVSGPNGSGKTSLLRMVCGLLPPAAGSLAWNGTSIRTARNAAWPSPASNSAPRRRCGCWTSLSRH